MAPPFPATRKTLNFSDFSNRRYVLSVSKIRAIVSKKKSADTRCAWRRFATSVDIVDHPFSHRQPAESPTPTTTVVSVDQKRRKLIRTRRFLCVTPGAPSSENAALLFTARES
ncbi:hypothetical protein Y032_0656g1230 [Ancylostoma ceylanicum]|uniref:Uncharacterized protein n=1 Tax=Ancylostoma ceylanicum TaxID=53326 RepID=A0A016WIH4_9BILA|nr:hypothetical protein Y032_0656g1230 [Ancylostoma ceylanicum]